ncbi:hypothetical protein ACOCEA_14160 [Maribacter sp. CXY002]|uniref:hypothetical protein n=1 Tax=Maribacter luteocoastalis TaxID=3407671 RepID=UPI003B66B56D
MMRIIPITLLLLIGSFNINAQRKSELIEQNQELKFQLDSIKRIISDAKQKEKLAELKASEIQSQVSELQDANATLLKNLNSFAALSSQNSENINKTLATLEIKEAQLKGIVNEVAGNDSTALVVLTNAKQTLGENAKVQVSNGTVIISEKLDYYFADGLGTKLLESAKPLLENIAKIANANPKTIITITGMSITGELDVALDQAATVAALLIKDYGINGERINAKGMDGGLKESLQIRIHPNYEGFYEKSKNDMKN